MTGVGQGGVEWQRSPRLLSGLAGISQSAWEHSLYNGWVLVHGSGRMMTSSNMAWFVPGLSELTRQVDLIP